jgi:hypothetical protein
MKAFIMFMAIVVMCCQIAFYSAIFYVAIKVLVKAGYL